MRCKSPKNSPPSKWHLAHNRCISKLIGFLLGLQFQLRKRGSSWNAEIWHIPEMHEPRSKISSPCSCDKNTTWRLKIDLLWAGEGLPEDEGSSAVPKKTCGFPNIGGQPAHKLTNLIFLKEDSPKLTQIDQNVWSPVWSKIFSYAHHGWCNIKLHDLNSKSHSTHV